MLDSDDNPDTGNAFDALDRLTVEQLRCHRIDPDLRRAVGTTRQQLSRARKQAQIVIIDWPSKEIRTMGVLTATFNSQDSDRKLAAVYVPTAPQTRLGYIRIVALDSVEHTDWTLKQWQLYQFTFASFSPEQFRSDEAE